MEPQDVSQSRDAVLRAEFDRRFRIWQQLKESASPDGVSPSLIQALHIHRGQMGLFSRSCKHTPERHRAQAPAVETLRPPHRDALEQRYQQTAPGIRGPLAGSEHQNSMAPELQ